MTVGHKFADGSGRRTASSRPLSARLIPQASTSAANGRSARYSWRSRRREQHGRRSRHTLHVCRSALSQAARGPAVVMNEATRRRLRAWTRQLHQQKYVRALSTAVHAGTVRLCTEHTGAHPTLHSCSPCSFLAPSLRFQARLCAPIVIIPTLGAASAVAVVHAAATLTFFIISTTTFCSVDGHLLSPPPPPPRGPSTAAYGGGYTSSMVVMMLLAEALAGAGAPRSPGWRPDFPPDLPSHSRGVTRLTSLQGPGPARHQGYASCSWPVHTVSWSILAEGSRWTRGRRRWWACRWLRTRKGPCSVL